MGCHLAAVICCGLSLWCFGAVLVRFGCNCSGEYVRQSINPNSVLIIWQVILFATLAIELKRKAPNAHTFLEVIKARYGPATHGVYITFGLMTNILVTAMLLTGGSAVVTSLCGVPTAAACFLLPVGVVLVSLSALFTSTLVD
jgi:Na+/proline symporter